MMNSCLKSVIALFLFMMILNFQSSSSNARSLMEHEPPTLGPLMRGPVPPSGPSHGGGNGNPPNLDVGIGLTKTESRNTGLKTKGPFPPSRPAGDGDSGLPKSDNGSHARGRIPPSGSPAPGGNDGGPSKFN